MRLQKGISSSGLGTTRRLNLHTNSYRTETRVLVEVSAHLGSHEAGRQVFLQAEFLDKDESLP
jgi:hypothetical protein